MVDAAPREELRLLVQQGLKTFPINLGHHLRTNTPDKMDLNPELFIHGSRSLPFAPVDRKVDGIDEALEGEDWQLRFANALVDGLQDRGKHGFCFCPAETGIQSQLFRSGLAVFPPL